MAGRGAAGRGGVVLLSTGAAAGADQRPSGDNNTLLRTSSLGPPARDRSAGPGPPTGSHQQVLSPPLAQPQDHSRMPTPPQPVAPVPLPAPTPSAPGSAPDGVLRSHSSCGAAAVRCGSRVWSTAEHCSGADEAAGCSSPAAAGGSSDVVLTPLSPCAEKSGIVDQPSIRVEPVQIDRSSLLRSSELADFTICFNGTEFRVHKALLAPVSEYFNQVLGNGQWTESTAGTVTIDIPGVQPSHLDWVLRFIYGDRDLSLSTQEIEPVLKVVQYVLLDMLAEQLVATAAGCVRSSSDLLRLGITQLDILERVAPEMEIDRRDVLPLLKLAEKAGASVLLNRCGTMLAETMLNSATDPKELAELPVVTLIGCFSSDVMAGLPSEDALLELMMRVCKVGEFDTDTQKAIAGCLRPQFLSIRGVEAAATWEAVDRFAVIAALAKSKEPSAFPSVPRQRSRRFSVAFSMQLSRGGLSFEEESTVVVHQSSKTARAVAVVDHPCDLGCELSIAFDFLEDKRGDEGTCFGVTPRHDVGTHDYRDAVGPLWRAFNGEIRESKFVVCEVRKLHPGDVVGLHLDGVRREVTFLCDGKPIVTQPVPADANWPLVPAVWFYGQHERVRVRAK
eukprot:TRINITY_DN7549_c0_g1_i2.p1 TRINITY_DN7549_c0_g1~~TRINITY_DN7549_c0_g1_i2.p1  ORF type:complete len:642 (+),score=146.29 TRINITY_DN7549_c0_g1_i2:75-1928(+)